MISLTWNRDFEAAWPEDDYEESRRKSDLGKSVPSCWSVGRRKNIPTNSKVFFFAQGTKHVRGLVARGIAVDVPESGIHWNDPTKKTNYVKLKLAKLLDLKDTIPASLLQERLPNIPWHAYGKVDSILRWNIKKHLGKFGTIFQVSRRFQSRVN